MTHSTEFYVAFDVPYGELSTMVVQPSDLLEELVIVFTNERDVSYVFNWYEQEFEKVTPAWPTKQP